MKQFFRFSSYLVNFLYRITIFLFDQGNTNNQIKVGQALRNLLEVCSPTYIKFGQLISHRPDILPKLFCDQLLSLTDDTQPISIEDIQHRIKESLGLTKIDIIEIQHKALGSASIAQVHKVLIQLEDGTQRWEAWKIQKGEIRKVFSRDLKYLRIITKFIDWLNILPPIDHLAQEYQLWIEEETDFINEANNIKKANTKNYFVSIIPSKIPTTIELPEFYGVHISGDGYNQLLRMEYIEGQNLNSIRLDITIDISSRRDIINQCLRGFFAQFLVYGFVQADPHISNLIWNSKKQKLTFVDWGLAREFSPIQGLNLLRMFRGFLTGNRNLCFDGLFGLLKVNDETISKIIPSLNIMFADIKTMSKNNSDLPYPELGSRFLTALLQILLEHKIKINSESSAIFKAMATTDAVYTTVCPSYSISDMLEIVVDVSQVFLQKLILQDSKIIDYSINIIDKDQKIRDLLLTQINTKLGKDIIEIVTGQFVAKNFTILSKHSMENERFFGMVEEIENLWLTSKTRQY